MTPATYDVVAIGNAIVDVIARADDAFIAENGLRKGSMQLLFSTDEAEALYERMGPGIETSGGSAANTLAGLAALGLNCGFIGQVADDQLGTVFTHDMRAQGVRFDTSPRPGDPPTARCLIVVTPDGQRTMNTFLGASQFLPAGALSHDLISDAAILYLEGYLWDPEEPRGAMRRAIETAKQAGRRVAFTLSDVFCIERHRADFLSLIADGSIDILFANENELLSLEESEDFEGAVASLSARVPLLVVTRSEHGAIAVKNGERAAVPAEPIDAVVDTTGAGDLFAAGFLAGQARGRSLEDSLTIGAICAAEVISHVGPRPQADIKAMVEARLG
ncbi:putative sugar kinase [Sphingomonas changbaiensis NBRC 104936]|uniref:Putative sugar kinase n=1 Tax=Sphingomonas changbaiensis NBRC 104936 TaxID=1219043 RepID=A0A0E9MR98_9SPHN|nr:adenosine kinase [Sphingomonas changbaiensis]GAO39998.1 putative sugar kinase [Sphingomonas changbaiensis NBRC 104936]